MNSNTIVLIALMLLLLSNNSLSTTTLFLLLGFLTASGCGCNMFCQNSTSTTAQ